MYAECLRLDRVTGLMRVEPNLKTIVYALSLLSTHKCNIYYKIEKTSYAMLTITTQNNIYQWLKSQESITSLMLEVAFVCIMVIH